MDGITPAEATRIPADDECVLPYMLQRRAERQPDQTWVVFDDLSSWTNRQALDRMRAMGAGLQQAGIGLDDKVLVWMPNGKLALNTWFSLNAVGAVCVSINTAYKGGVLEHVIGNSDARVMLCHPDLADRLLELGNLSKLAIVYTEAGKAASDAARFAAAGLELRSLDQLECAPDPALPVAGLKPWNVQAICYTSGTTGPSKGVLSTYHHLYSMGYECCYGVGPDDRYLVNIPLFHVAATLVVYGALARNASIAVMGPFKTDTFLQTSKSLGATCCILLGSMAGFLMRSPEKESDRDHLLRRVMVVPLELDAPAMSARFGFNVYTVFNMSEVSCPLRSEDNPVVRGSCGQVRPGIQARLVDRNDCEVALGSPGELILRSDLPWTMSHGYYKNPEATASAWRNGWFHTGDVMRVDAEGNYFFVDRVKDSIRRRGENISSFEVEAEVLAFPGIFEAAVIGVPSDLGEEDVLAVVVPKPGHAICNETLLTFLQGRLPYFMVPRYIHHLAELPKTATAKVEKHVLRSQALQATAWDREGAGFSVKRDSLRG
ncbi:AMP-binding protein [Herbaspirillum sp. alder98]|uniref:AMP-binding protein n=1 Tax=Herbaspirillum sp. alder98 TaxID=2913096 RepID=UPI001CD8AA8F|nr:AMP-binding protein [Herbaspirillum sp. alder98]MCA1326074.1 AMP-binding protein [Herbaspirillum sp. alder98]